MNNTERAISDLLSDGRQRTVMDIGYDLDQPDPSIRRTLLAMTRRDLVKRKGSRGMGYQYYLPMTPEAASG